MEKITIIHLNESTPFKNISKVGWTTNNNENISLKDLELVMSELFIDADARTYAVESYVVHKNITMINANEINIISPYGTCEIVSTTSCSLDMRLLAIIEGLSRVLFSKSEIDKFDKISMLNIQPKLPINIVPNIISLRVLLLDIFTKNVPTIGASAYHHAQ